MAGLYVHIPFCASRCIYCGFYSTTEWNLQSSYVDALLAELQMRKDYLKGEKITTVYFGGGTPSTLSPVLLRRLCDGISTALDTGDVEEWTMECNPDDVSPEFAEVLKSLPVNRVSIGVQTFDADRLAWLHRRHTPEQVVEAVRSCRENGIENISLDLMFGFPKQTVSCVREDVKKLLKLRPEHVSAYSLMYEEGTVLHKKLRDNEVEEVTEEESLDMYNAIIDDLSSAGYEHYEISNFALPGYRSKHNSSYWHEVPYLGLGAAAHSYNILSREWNISNLRKYIASVEAGELPCEQEPLDEDTRYNDLVTTALRTREGIDMSRLTADYAAYLKREAAHHIANGNLRVDGTNIHLTRKGLYVSDSVMADLIKV